MIYNVVGGSCKRHVHWDHAATDGQRRVLKHRMHGECQMCCAHHVSDGDLFVFGSWRHSRSLRICASLAHVVVPIPDFFRPFNLGHNNRSMGSTPGVWTAEAEVRSAAASSAKRFLFDKIAIAT